jgi:galactitol-specific phosphotransferase system IIB component
MSKKYFILIVCGMGYSTSNVIKINLRKFFSEQGIDTTLQSTSLSAIKTYLPKADIIVTSMGLNPDNYSVPVINAVDLISGRNKQKIYDEILAALMQKGEE